MWIQIDNVLYNLKYVKSVYVSGALLVLEIGGRDPIQFNLGAEEAQKACEQISKKLGPIKFETRYD